MIAGKIHAQQDDQQDEAFVHDVVKSQEDKHIPAANKATSPSLPVNLPKSKQSALLRAILSSDSDED